MNRRQFLVAPAAGVGGLVAGGAVADTYTFEIVRDERRIPTLRARVRVAFLSDLHDGPFIREASVAAWVDATMAQGVDLIVLGGDLVDRVAGIEVLVNRGVSVRPDLYVAGIDDYRTGAP